MRASVTVACVLVLAVSGPRQAEATSYTIRDLSPGGYAVSGLYALDVGQFVGYAKGTPTNGHPHAFLWNDSTGTTVDLNPAGYGDSQVNGVRGGVQVGECYGLVDGRAHAFLWGGSTASAVDLHPAGCLDSAAKAVANGQQVGSATPSGQNYHAALWRGSAASLVDLNPSGYTASLAYAIDGGQEVGDARAATDHQTHALLWNGSSTDYVDLHSAGFNYTRATGIAGGQQVGYGHTTTDNSQHALLWTGSASSAVDLNPAWLTNSVAQGVMNGLQVGGGWGPLTGDYEHALLWNGTADSVIDLHSCLGSGYRSSGAYAIDAYGNIAGYADDLAGNHHAIEWVPVPEPATLSLLALGGLLIARRRRLTAPVVVVLLMVGVLAGSATSASAADVFHMGGTRDPATGQWTGSASLEFVTVGDINNAADTTAYGSVGYTYQMGKYDVTAAQYCAFLSAVAATDPYGLYNTYMAPANNLPAVLGGAATFGITQSGSPGSYSYSVTGNPNFPMNQVTWGDAARFCNWLANGQPTTGAEGSGTTETGSYTLNGATSYAALMGITRNGNATYVIPSENEWYKAAYYKGGANAGYWAYPTQSNSQPSNALSPTGTNNANYCYNDFTDPTNYLTVVGAFASSPGAYRTFDMGGDVWQWNEANINGSNRGLRGGSFGGYSYDSLRSSFRSSNFPAGAGEDYYYVGFRVALVPEPATLSLLALGSLLIARRRRA